MFESKLGRSPGTNELPIRPKNLKIRPPGYLFNAAFDVDAPRPQNTDQKGKNNQF